MELERSDYEKASLCKGKGCFAKNAQGHPTRIQFKTT